MYMMKGCCCIIITLFVNQFSHFVNVFILIVFILRQINLHESF